MDSAERLPEAVRVLGAMAARREWSTREPLAHLACCRFASLEAAREIGDGAAIKRLIGEFDRLWAPRAVQRRDIPSIAEETGGSGTT